MSRIEVLDIVLVTPDLKEYSVGEAKHYESYGRDDEGHIIWDVNWYVGAFEEYVSKALGELNVPDVAEMKLLFRPVGGR